MSVAAGPSTAPGRGDRVAGAGIAVAALVFTVQLVAQLVNFWGFELRSEAFDSNSPASIFGRLESAAVLAATVALTVFALQGRSRLLASALAGASAVLFVDNVFKLHEEASAPVKLGLLLLLGFVFLGLWALTAAFAPRARRVVRGGLWLLAASLVIHRLGPPVLDVIGADHTHWQYQVKVALKEGTQVGGWLLLAAGVAAAATATTRRA